MIFASEGSMPQRLESTFASLSASMYSISCMKKRSTRALSIWEVPVYSAPMLAVAMKTHSGWTLMFLRPFPPAMSTGSSLRESRHGRRMLLALRGALESSSRRMIPGFWMSSVNFA